MSREARLSGVDRGRVLPEALPAPRVRVRMPSRARAHLRPEQTDNLREARGILYSAVLGGVLWVLIGLIALFIVR